MKSRTAKLTFCIAVLIIPLIQFLIFYCYVNVNSFRLAFVDVNGDFVGFANFRTFFRELFIKGGNWQKYVGNSFGIYFLNFVTMQPLGLLMSYLVYKKTHTKWMQVVMTILCVPMVMSPVVLTTIYQSFVDALGVTFFGSGAFEKAETAFWVIFLYSFWSGFGSGIILNCNFLRGIPSTVIEAARLDGVNFLSEFIYIELPYLFRLWKMNFITGLPALFTNQFFIFEFYGQYPKIDDLTTIGFYLFQQTLEGPSKYPYTSAIGLVVTAVILPISFGARWLLNKIDPMEN